MKLIEDDLQRPAGGTRGGLELQQLSCSSMRLRFVACSKANTSSRSLSSTLRSC